MSREQIFPGFAGGVKQTEDGTVYRLWMGGHGHGAYIEGTLDDVSAVVQFIQTDLRALVAKRYALQSEGDD